MAAANNNETLLQTSAYRYAEHGVAIFPIVPLGKLPAIPKCPVAKAQGLHGIALAEHTKACPNEGHGYLDATTDLDTVKRWWTRWPDANIGIALGANNIFCLDVDGPDGRKELDELEAAYGTLPTTYVVLTGRIEGSGLHYLYRQPRDGPPVRSCKPFNTPKLEIKGAGGYVVAPPSMHGSGRPYVAQGSWSQIADSSAWLIGIAKRAPVDDDDVPEPPPPPRTTTPATGPQERAEARLRRLAGTVAMAEDGKRNDVLNWAAYQAGRIIAVDLLDEEAATSSLQLAAQRAGLTDDEILGTIASGIGAGRQDPDIDATFDHDIPPVTTLPNFTDLSDDEPAENRAGPWAVADVAAVLSGDYRPPRPTLLVREDNIGLLYPGETNVVFGESESGKSWVALYAAAQCLQAEIGVLFIDFEATVSVIVGRLQMLGVSHDSILKCFAYISPDAPLAAEGLSNLRAAVINTRPGLIVLDGITGAMGLHGWDPLSNADAEKFDRLLPRPLSATGAAVLSVDHIPKSREADSKYAMGAQHKRAAVTGAAYRIDVVRTLAPGHVGQLKLSISKDRHGQVRAEHPTVGGFFKFDATDPEEVQATIEPPPPPSAPFRPTHLMEKVSRILELSDGLLKGEIVERIDSKKQHVIAAIDCLAAEGHIALEKAARNAMICRLVKPYRNEEAL